MHCKQRLQCLLDRQNVHVRDPMGTIARLAALIDGGVNNLTVITDFDHTLSRSHDAEGKKCAVTHEVFGHPRRFPELSQKFAELEKKYGIFEHLTEGEERIAMMEAWWSESNDAIVERAFVRSEIASFVTDTNIELRYGAAELMEWLEQNGVPTLIFSAGIGDVITVFLEQTLSTMSENAHVVSNMMKFDEEDRICGFSAPLIHCFNKSGAMVDKSSPVLPLLASRPNVLLMGDALGDVGMVEGLGKKEENTIKIGFLNSRPSMLAHFVAAFDIVIVDDQTMEIPLEIVNMMK